MVSCPECLARAKKKVQDEYEANTPEEERRREDLLKLYDEIDCAMKMDIRTKHFTCPKCGLYATREQVSDIRERLNRREATREDRQDDYLAWWQKSKKEKQHL